MYCSSSEVPTYAVGYEESRCINTNPEIVQKYIDFLSSITIEGYERTTRSKLTINPYFQRQLSCLVDAILESNLVEDDLREKSKNAFRHIFYQLRVLPYGNVEEGYFDLIPTSFEIFESMIKKFNPFRIAIPNFQFLYGFYEGYCIAEQYVKLANVLHILTSEEVKCVMDQVLSAIVVSNLSSSLGLKDLGIKRLTSNVNFPTCDPGKLFVTDLIPVILFGDLEFSGDIVNSVSSFISDIIFDETHSQLGVEYWSRLGFGPHDEWLLGAETQHRRATIKFSGPHIVNGNIADHQEITNCELMDIWK